MGRYGVVTRGVARVTVSFLSHFRLVQRCTIQMRSLIWHSLETIGIPPFKQGMVFIGKIWWSVRGLGVSGSN